MKLKEKVFPADLHYELLKYMWVGRSSWWVSVDVPLEGPRLGMQFLIVLLKSLVDKVPKAPWHNM